MIRGGSHSLRPVEYTAGIGILLKCIASYDLHHLDVVAAKLVGHSIFDVVTSVHFSRVG